MAQVEQTHKVILIVEDSVTQGLHLEDLLADAGLKVLWAKDGQSALEMAHLTKPDLIVLDIQLPDMNGFQLCKMIKSESDLAEVPVIMLTRYDDPEAVVLGLQTGVVDYIPKDVFADAVLMETLKHIGLVETATEI